MWAGAVFGAMVEISRGRVQANGIEFAYRARGDGDRLALCLHGFPDDAGSMDPLLDRLAGAGFTAVAPFMRGYGPTEPAPDGDYTAGALAGDAIALVDALAGQFDFDGGGSDPGSPADGAVLVGHDWGAVAGYAAASRAPGRFSRLVAMAVPPQFPQRALEHPRQLLRSWYMGFFQLPDLPERALQTEEFALVDLLWGLWSPGWDYPAERIASVKDTLSTPGTVEAALAYYRQLGSAMASQLFEEAPEGTAIQVPGLVLAGEDDGCIGAELFGRSDEAFDAPCRVVKVRGAGHFLHQERPDTVAEEILAFVEG